jgi:hypothetical protein
MYSTYTIDAKAIKKTQTHKGRQGEQAMFSLLAPWKRNLARYAMNVMDTRSYY